MKGLAPLFLGIFGTFAFSWAGLALIPNAQIGHLDPQMDEEGTDVYPAPKSGMAERGRQVYIGERLRLLPQPAGARRITPASDIERKWGDRRSAPRDYIFDRPALLGRMRMGPDLANVGKRAPVDDENPRAADATQPTQAAPAAGARTARSCWHNRRSAPRSATAGASPRAAAAAPAPPPTGQPLPPALLRGDTGCRRTAAPQLPPARQRAVTRSGCHSADGSRQRTGATGRRVRKASRCRTPRPGIIGISTIRAASTVHSIMPSFRFLYEKRRISGERSADAIQFNGVGAPEEG